MCGIAGIVGTINEGEVARLSAMLEAMVHRGPDQDGQLHIQNAAGGALLGHRRLSILDLSTAGRQPMQHTETGVTLSYNGECYNYREIRKELIGRGHRFESQTDSEVILKAYVEWGEASIERLRGMFALAIWDPRRGEMLMSRDRLGIKPLYYERGQNSFAFASEVRSLLAGSQRRRRLNPEALSAYLWHGFIPGSDTLVEGIELLAAGTILRVDATGTPVASHRYWQIPQSDENDDSAAAIRNCQQTLEDAVAIRLVSDVPLGVFLSGGVDSSVVAALAQQASSTPIDTFNIRFDEPGYDESRYARAVADSLGTHHHEIPITESSFRENLSSALQSLDQPTFDGINTFFVSRAVRDAGITVALSGAGGDELFGGYASFVDIPRIGKIAKALRWLPSGSKRFAANALMKAMYRGHDGFPPQVRWGKLSDVLHSDGDAVRLYQSAYSQFTREFHASLHGQDNPVVQWGLKQDVQEALRQNCIGRSQLQTVSMLELNSFITDRLLRDTDCASMASSLEVRVPLLDHRFIESLATLPDKLRYQPIRQKQFLRSTIESMVPATIFDRPKAGFEIPLDKWCRRSLIPQVEATLEDADLCHSAGLNSEAVSRLWRAYRSDSPGLYWSRVWLLYVLLDWCRRHSIYQ